MVFSHKEASSVSDEPHIPPEESSEPGYAPAANGESAESAAGLASGIVEGDVVEVRLEDADSASAETGDAGSEDAVASDAEGEEAVAEMPETVVVPKKEKAKRSKPAAAAAPDLGADGRGIPAAEASGAADRPDPTGERNWYILKVQSNREDSIKDALQRRIAIEGLQDFFGDIIVPIEMVSEFKAGKKRTVKRKLYPGYIVVHMEINDDTWHMVRGTPGIGDFVGSAGKPTPMLPKEVEKIIQKQEDLTSDQPPPVIQFRQGDRVKVTGGNFENFEGEIGGVDSAKGRVTVIIQIFNRPTPVDLEYWQVEAV